MADLPPTRQWHADDTGLFRWRPAIDRIDVFPNPLEGGHVLRLMRDGVETLFHLPREQSAHLARLLQTT